MSTGGKQMAIKRKLSTAKSKRYWAFIDRAADEVSNWPGWMQQIGTGEVYDSGKVSLYYHDRHGSRVYVYGPDFVILCSDYIEPWEVATPPARLTGLQDEDRILAMEKNDQSRTI